MYLLQHLIYHFSTFEQTFILYFWKEKLAFVFFSLKFMSVYDGG